jgi:sulfoxide reductase heme-binding subunit YedZ
VRLSSLLVHPAAKWVLGAAVAAPALALAWAAWHDRLGPNPAEALIRSSGEWTLRMLCVALAVTPLRLALRLPVLARFRRMLGLSVFVYASLHAACYAWLDMGLDAAALWADVVQRPFILAGALAWCGLLVLAATSPHVVARALGPTRWKRVHQAVWLVAAAAVLHFVWMRAGKNLTGTAWAYGAVLLALWLSRKISIKKPSSA